MRIQSRANRAMDRSRRERRGAALLAISVLILFMAVLSTAFMKLNTSAHSEQRQQRKNMRALFAAEAAVNECYFDFKREAITHKSPPGSLGSEANPREIGGAEYWVDYQNLGTRVYSLEGTGVDGNVRDRIELVIKEEQDGFFRYAVFGNEGVEMNASAFVDSYDSDLGSYASQYDTSAGYADVYGNVGSNEDITLLTNSEIYGNATPGPGHIVDDSAPQTFVYGSKAPATALVPLPPIPVPPIPSSGPLSVSGPPMTLGAGQYHFDSLEVKGDLTFQGPAEVVVDDLTFMAGSKVTVDTANGPVKFYCTGDVDMRSNSQLITQTQVPWDMQIYITTDNSQGNRKVVMNANSQFYGVVYAPNAKVKIEAMFEIFGSVMGRHVELASNSSVHYDSSLLFNDDNGPPNYLTVSWRPITHL